MVVMRYIHDCTDFDIADQFQCRQVTLRINISRALRVTVPDVPDEDPSVARRSTATQFAQLLARLYAAQA